MSLVFGIRVLLYLIMLTISYFFGATIVGIIFVFVINFIILNIIIWMIPTNLNWSYNLYNHNLYQIIISAIIAILSFTFIYQNITIKVDGVITSGFIDSLHLSLSMFGGLGYGEVLLSKYKIITSLQSIIGFCYIPILAAYIWMYIQNRIRTPSHLDEEIFKASENEILQYNNQLGVLKVIENPEAVNSRNKKFRLNTCKNCDNKIIDIIAFIEPQQIMPFKKYICQCTNCGNISKQKNNVYRAVNDWNDKNIS